jgi:hypothetical protein
MPKPLNKKKKLKPSQTAFQSEESSPTQAPNVIKGGKTKKRSKDKNIDDMSMNEFDNLLNVAVAETKVKEKAARKKAAETAKFNKQKKKSPLITTATSKSMTDQEKDNMTDQFSNSSDSTIRNATIGSHTSLAWVPYVINYCRKFDFIVKIKKIMIQNSENFSVIFPEDVEIPNDYRNLHFVPSSDMSDDEYDEDDKDVEDDEDLDNGHLNGSRRIYARPLLDHERIQELSDSEEEKRSFRANKTHGTKQDEEIPLHSLRCQMHLPEPTVQLQPTSIPPPQAPHLTTTGEAPEVAQISRQEMAAAAIPADTD